MDTCRHQRIRRRAVSAEVGVGLIALFTLPVQIAAQIIPSTPTCSDCRIRVAIVERFGSTDARALPTVPLSSITLDSHGRYWLLFFGQTPPLITSGRGSQILELGKRGAGPGEFQHAQLAAQLPGDSMVILDRLARRATVYDSTLRPVRSIQIEAGNFFDFEVGFWPKLFLSSAFLTRDRIGWPLHAFDMSQSQAVPIKTFGLEEANINGPRGMERLESDLVATRKGTLWAVDKLRYRMSEWTQNGELVRVLERKPRWFSEVSTGDYGRRDEPPPPQVAGANIDGDGRLWLYILTAAPTWREAWADVPRPPRAAGEVPASVFRPNLDRLYQTVIEIIDPQKNELVARGVTRHRVVKALSGPGLVAAQTLDEEGRSVVIVLRFSLQR